MSNNQLDEEKRVKDQLVNSSLVISSIVGLPLMIASIIRANLFHVDLFLVSHITFYLIVLAATLFRDRIIYSFRAGVILAILYLLAFIDFYITGFVSIGFLWITTAVVMSVLYFDFKRGLIAVGIGLFLILLISFLNDEGIISYHIDYNAYASSSIILALRTMAYLITSLIIIFSLRLIYNTLNTNLNLLKLQKEDLIKSTDRLIMENQIRMKSEQHALENEYKFRNIFEISSDPIAIIGMNGRFIDFNLAFIGIAELEAKEIAEAHFLDLIPEELKADFEKYKVDLENVPSRFDLKYKKNSGTSVYLDVSTTIINYSGEKAVLTIFRDDTDKINRDRTILSATLEAEEKERLRLSKELHDGLGPLLSTLKIYLDVLEKRPGEPEIQNRINSTLAESIKSVKEISNNLSPYVLQNLGIVKALRGFIDKIAFNKEIEIDFESNLEQRLSENIEISLYRLTTELLNNTIKHANAQKVSIRLMIDSPMLYIHYEDDGVGFNKTELTDKTSGIGLFNIKSRIEGLGGEVYIHTKSGEGFRFLAQIDIHEIN